MDENLAVARLQADLADEALKAAELLAQNGLTRSSLDRMDQEAADAAECLEMARRFVTDTLALVGTPSRFASAP